MYMYTYCTHTCTCTCTCTYITLHSVFVIQNALQQMAEKSGIGNTLIDTDLSGPTQVCTTYSFNYGTVI